MITPPPEHILRVRIISAKMSTFWYSKFIGRYMFAIEENEQMYNCSEYGVKYRAFFDKEDVKIVETIKLKDTRIIKNIYGR